MMIPTSGSSTSISSKASSTAGISVGIGSLPEMGTSEISLTFSSLRLSGHALDGAGGDVVAHLHAVERDAARRTVSALTGRGRGGAEPGDVEDAPAGGDDLPVQLGGPGVGHLGKRRRLGEAMDRISIRGRRRIAG